MTAATALADSVWVLGSAAVLGILVAGMGGVLRPGTRVWWGGLLHGALGLGGVALLLLGLQGPVRGVQAGASSFGPAAAALTGAALLIGLLVLANQLRGKQPGILVIGLHATLAVFGVVLLAAYLSA